MNHSELAARSAGGLQDIRMPAAAVSQGCEVCSTAGEADTSQLQHTAREQILALDSVKSLARLLDSVLGDGGEGEKISEAALAASHDPFDKLLSLMEQDIENMELSSQDADFNPLAETQITIEDEKTPKLNVDSKSSPSNKETEVATSAPAHELEDAPPPAAGHDWATLLVFTCPSCNIRVATRERASHVAAHHGRGGGPGADTLDRPVLYQCLVCIANVDWRRDTIREHLAGHKMSLDDYAKQFESPIEKQIKKQTEILKKELEKISIKPEVAEKKQVEKKVKCPNCEKLFSTNFGLQRHMKSDHAEANTSHVKNEQLEQSSDQFHCNVCKFKSNKKGPLTFHTSKYHESTEEVKCCRRSFSTRWDLFVHLRDKHRGEKDAFNKHQVWPGLEKYI